MSEQDLRRMASSRRINRMRGDARILRTFTPVPPAHYSPYPGRRAGRTRSWRGLAVRGQRIVRRRSLAGEDTCLSVEILP